MTEYHQFVQRAAASIFAELGSSITDPFQLRAKSEEAWRRAHLLAAQFEHLELDDRDIIDRLHAAAATFLDFHSDMFEYELDAVEPSVVVRTVSPVKDQGGLVVVDKSLRECSPFVVFEKLAHYLRRLRKQSVELLQGIHVKLITSIDTAEDFRQISHLLTEDRMPELYARLGLGHASADNDRPRVAPDAVYTLPAGTTSTADVRAWFATVMTHTNGMYIMHRHDGMRLWPELESLETRVWLTVDAGVAGKLLWFGGKKQAWLNSPLDPASPGVLVLDKVVFTIPAPGTSAKL